MEMIAAPELFKHGILTEQSDVRAHVGVFARQVFAFRTAVAIKLLTDSGRFPSAPASQPGVSGVTAMGWKVPLDAIPGLRAIPCASWRGWEQFNECLSTSAKGKLAVALVVTLLRNGRFPLWVSARDDERESVQINGTDLVIFARQKIQVKCDYCAGPVGVHPRCTGNLYLQFAERNPLRRI